MFFKERKADYWLVLQPTWDRVDLHVPAEKFLAQLAREHPAAQTLLAAQWAFSEIENGAIPQFFHNSSGVLAPEALLAFEQLGFAEAVKTLAAAMALLGEPYPRDRGERNRRMGHVFGKEAKNNPLLDTLLDLSGNFYDAFGRRRRDFAPAMDEYAAMHREAILAHNAQMPPEESSSLVECATHGIQESALICVHLSRSRKEKEAGGKPLGFIEPINEEDEASEGNQAWCRACDEMLVSEGLQWTDKAMEFSDPRMVCMQCYEAARVFHDDELPAE